MDPVLAALWKASETGLMPQGSAILLAVSGGADSMALLTGAAQIAPKARWRLAVGHVHHGWRGREADRDLQFVREHARRLQLPFSYRKSDAREQARRLKLSPEAAARHVRYLALRELAREAGAQWIATAHQREDRIECFLLGCERKAGLARLAGPHARRADGVVRPLLEVSRGQILQFLQSRGISFRRDASNGDLRLDRNRLRREVARIRTEQGEAALEALARVVAALAQERDRIEREFSERVAPRLFRGPGAVVADAAYLASCSPAICRRAIEEAAAPFAAPGRPPLTGREREQILRRLAEGDDFRFEAGRRIRFERRGPVLCVRGRAPGRRKPVYDSPGHSLSEWAK